MAKQIGMPRAVNASTKLPKNAVSLDLDASMDGTWDLNLSGITLDSKNKYTGTAQIMLSDGSTLNFNLSGTYIPKTNISIMALAGIGNTKGTTISGQFTYNSGFLHPFKKITGKIVGQ